MSRGQMNVELTSEEFDDLYRLPTDHLRKEPRQAAPGGHRRNPHRAGTGGAPEHRDYRTGSQEHRWWEREADRSGGVDRWGDGGGERCPRAGGGGGREYRVDLRQQSYEPGGRRSPRDHRSQSHDPWMGFETARDLSPAGGDAREGVHVEGACGGLDLGGLDPALGLYRLDSLCLLLSHSVFSRR